MNGEKAKEILDILTEKGANPGGWLPREAPEKHAARLKAKREAKAKAEEDEEPVGYQLLRERHDW